MVIGSCGYVDDLGGGNGDDGGGGDNDLGRYGEDDDDDLGGCMVTQGQLSSHG